MQKLTTFFRTFLKSISQPKYYADVVRAKLSFAVKYFGFFHFLESIVLAIVAMVALSAVNFSAMADQTLTTLPPDLVVRLENGKLAINKPLPYVISLPQDMRYTDYGGTPDTFTEKDITHVNNLVVFDTNEHVKKAPDFLTYFLAHNTAVLVTEDSIYTYGKSDDGQLHVYPLSDMKNFTLSSQQVLEAKNHFFSSPFMTQKWYVYIAGVFMILFIFPVLFIFRFLTASIYAGIMHFLASFFKGTFFNNKRFSYGEVLRVSLLTFVPLLILQAIIQHIGFSSFGMAMVVDMVRGWGFFLLYILFTGIALRGASEEVSNSVDVPSKPKK